ncbi:TRAP transporter large permease subunit, partial [Mesorhizobium sp. M2D.F.Ca.ET.153.01.1.1]|uniref:TRAP transporter large permease subunit n=1 Tax=Mesorhizobium sp. M2D.F.Ca.ET.153.01.1.1 TaxID=2500520 RepID=UPI001AEE9099
ALAEHLFERASRPFVMAAVPVQQKAQTLGRIRERHEHFLQTARCYGIDPIHFGLVLVPTGGLGLVTPPVGSVLFIGTSIGKISVGQSMRTIWPVWFAALGVLLVVT